MQSAQRKNGVSSGSGATVERLRRGGGDSLQGRRSSRGLAKRVSNPKHYVTHNKEEMYRQCQIHTRNGNP